MFAVSDGVGHTRSSMVAAEATRLRRTGSQGQVLLAESVRGRGGWKEDGSCVRMFLTSGHFRTADNIKSIQHSDVYC